MFSSHLFGEPLNAITSAVSIQDNEFHTKGFIATPYFYCFFSASFFVLFVVFFYRIIEFGNNSVDFVFVSSCMFFPPEFYSLKYFNIVAFKKKKTFLETVAFSLWNTVIAFGLLSTFCYTFNVQPYDVQCHSANGQHVIFFMYINIYVYIYTICLYYVTIIYIGFSFFQLNASDFRKMSVHFFCESGRCN